MLALRFHFNIEILFCILIEFGDDQQFLYKVKLFLKLIKQYRLTI